MPNLPTALTGSVNDQIVVRSKTVDGYGGAAVTTVVWTTSNATVATVQATIDVPGGAVITCLIVGTATITATAGSVSAVFYLNVVNLSPGAATAIEVGVDQIFQKRLRQ